MSARNSGVVMVASYPRNDRPKASGGKNRTSVNNPFQLKRNFALSICLAIRSYSIESGLSIAEQTMAASAPRSPPKLPGPGRLRARVFVSLAALFAAFLGSGAAVLWYRYDQAIGAAHRRADNLDLILTEHFRRSVAAVDATLT